MLYCFLLAHCVLHNMIKAYYLIHFVSSKIDRELLYLFIFLYNDAQCSSLDNCACSTFDIGKN